MSSIERMPEETGGVDDGVKLAAKCVLVKFGEKSTKSVVSDCKIIASWTAGNALLSYTEQGERRMIIVRIDELVALLHEAGVAFYETQEGRSYEPAQ